MTKLTISRNYGLEPLEEDTKGHKSVPFCTLSGFRPFQISHLESMAGTTGLEPATSAVTGQRSNQLSYVPFLFS
jgi:hypothetical protein